MRKIIKFGRVVVMKFQVTFFSHIGNLGNFFHMLALDGNSFGSCLLSFRKI